MVQAYILIQSEVGRSSAVAASVAGIAGVVKSEEVTGPYDVIARVEADEVTDLGKVIIAKIQEIPGITRTLTCTVVES